MTNMSRPSTIMAKLTVIMSFVLLCVSSYAQEMPLSVELQRKLLLKIYNFDRSLEDTLKKELRLGVLYQSNYGLSRKTYESLQAMNAESLKDSIEHRQLKWIEVDISKSIDLEQAIKADSLDIIYVCPLRAVDVWQITEICRRNGVRTCSGVPDYVSQGVVVTLDVRGDKPLIVINLKASKQERSAFDAQLLNFARVIE